MCSKKVTGVALAATGVILIVVGVIVGVLLTNMAQKAVEDTTCVNNKDSSGYKIWVSLSTLPSIRSRKASLTEGNGIKATWRIVQPFWSV